VQRGSRVVLFGYESEKRCIEGLEDLPRSSRVLDDIPNIFADDAPVVVEEVGGKPVRPRSLAQWGVPKILIDFLLCDRSHKNLVLLFSDLLADILEDGINCTRTIYEGFC
jgi:hypothetical protein